MSSLFARLKKDVLIARKDGDKAVSGVGLVLIGDLETQAKRSGDPVSDDQVIAKAKKLIESNREMLDRSTDDSQKEKLQIETGFLETLLPAQMSEDEIEKAIRDSGATNIGQAMGALKKQYSGQFDGKTASAIAKKLFQ